MPDSITISHSFAQDIKCALDDALRCINVHETDDTFDPQKAIGGIVRVRAELVNMLSNNIVLKNGNSDILQRQQGLHILKQLDNVRRMVKKDYGLEDAA